MSSSTSPLGRVSLEKRNRTYHVRYTDPAGRRRRSSLKTGDRREAEKRAREYSDLLDQGDEPALESRRTARGTLFRTFLVEFRNNWAHWSPTTWSGNKSRLQAIEDAFGDLPLGAISSRDIETFLAALRDNPRKLKRIGEKPRTTATINRYVAALKVIFRAAIEWGYIGASPMARVKLRPESQKRPEGLHRDELERLLFALEPQGYPWALSSFAADTGLRRSEIYNLDWDDVDLDRGTVVVRDTKDPRSRRFRTVPLTRRARAVLETIASSDIIRFRTQESFQFRPRLGPPVREGQIFRPVEIKRALQTAAETAGLGTGFHFHQLRHTYTTILLDQGVPINDVQYLLGHKSIATTQRYDHPDAGRFARALDALEDDPQ